jgi:hypothetical protein
MYCAFINVLLRRRIFPQRAVRSTSRKICLEHIMAFTRDNRTENTGHE